MASTASKIDAAADKAYASAASKKTETAQTSDDVSVKAIAEAVEADTPAPSAKSVEKPAKKSPVKKSVKKKPMEASAEIADAPTGLKSSKKETLMNKAQTKASDYTAQMKQGAANLQADMQERAQTAYGKGTEIASEMGDFTKGNVEAMVASGKILATGMQDMGKTYVEDAKGAVAVVTTDMKEVAAVRSPTELVQLQSKIASRNFDATVAAVSKNTEAWVKLANEAFAPLSNRMSVAMEKVRKAA